MTDTTPTPAGNLPAPTNTVPDVTEAPEFKEVVAYLAKAIETLYDLVKAHPDDTKGLAMAQITVARMRKELDLLADEITPILWDSMGDAKELTVEGLGHLTKRYGTANNQWDHETIWQDIARLAADEAADSETGEVLSPRDAARHGVEIAREIVAQGAYKKTALRSRLGIEADQVSQVTWGKRSVQITGGPK